MRFELRYGKFGPYFYDTGCEADMSLVDVLCALNHRDLEDDLVEQYAKCYHEMCREMVNKQIGMITKPTQPYIEWDALTEDQKKGRYFIAKKILGEILGLH